MSVNTVDPSLYQVGYLTLNEQGAILVSGGELENDERKADIFYRLVTMQKTVDKFLEEGCSRITVNFKDHSYCICMSNKKIYIVKKKLSANIEDDSYLVNTNIPIANPINAQIELA